MDEAGKDLPMGPPALEQIDQDSTWHPGISKGTRIGRKRKPSEKARENTISELTDAYATNTQGE